METTDNEYWHRDCSGFDLVHPSDPPGGPNARRGKRLRGARGMGVLTAAAVMLSVIPGAAPPRSAQERGDRLDRVADVAGAAKYSDLHPSSYARRPLSAAIEVGVVQGQAMTQAAVGGGITFYDDLALFLVATGAAGKELKGTEDFEEAVVVDIAVLGCDPLDTTCNDGVFAPGDILYNLAFQSNIASPGNVKALGGGLVVLAPPFAGALNKAVGPDAFDDSFDILSLNPNHTAVSLSVVDLGLPAGTLIEVRVFDKSNFLMGMTTVVNANPDGTFVGFLVPDPDTIGRINLRAHDGVGTEGGELVYDMAAYVAGGGDCCGDPTAGDCYVVNNTPCCDNAGCCELVCSVDPFCCDPLGGWWDELCVEEAVELCAQGGACCNTGSGSCMLVASEAECKGEYMGDGTDCRDSDGDGLADWFESNDCNDENRNHCHTGTDPNNPDTDGDGLLDGYELKKTKCDPCVPDAIDLDDDGIGDVCAAEHFIKFSQPPKPVLRVCMDDPFTECDTDADCLVCVGGTEDGRGCARPEDLAACLDGGGTCTGTSTCIVVPPGAPGEDYPSDLDWNDGMPGQKVADDFVSDGRPITAVRWWGSNIPPPDPKVCYDWGDVCPDPAACSCSPRPDGTFNCVDDQSLADCPPVPCSLDSECDALLPGSKCFGVEGTTEGCCAYNCGENPKVCSDWNDICDDPSCPCTPRPDGSFNCADFESLANCPPIGCSSDSDCDTIKPGTKCFGVSGTDEGCCAYNCGESPKVCSDWDDVCPDPSCPCTPRPDGSFNCADPVSLADCPPEPCYSDDDCDIILPGTKCFGLPGTDGCCAYNCGEAPAKSCDEPGDSPWCGATSTDCGATPGECHCAVSTPGGFPMDTGPGVCADTNSIALPFPIECFGGDMDCAAAGFPDKKCVYDSCFAPPWMCVANCQGVSLEDGQGTVADSSAGAVSVVATHPPEPSVDVAVLRALGVSSALAPEGPSNIASTPDIVHVEATWEQMRAFDAEHPAPDRQTAPVHEAPRPQAIDGTGDTDGLPQAAATPDGSGTVAAPPLNVSFQGITDTGWIPPDTMGAVGMNHIATIVNGGFEVFDRNGGVVSGPITLQAFWSALGTAAGLPASIPFDPKIIYDQYSDRWIATSDGNPNNRDGTNNSWVLVGISKSNTPTGSWNLYAIRANIAGDHANYWSDYPGIGVDPNNVVITNNMFTVAADPSYIHADVWVISKASMISGGPLNYALFHDPCGTGGFTFQPTHTFGQSSANAVIHLVDQGWVDLDTRTRRFLRVKDIRGVGGAAVLNCRGGNDWVEVNGYNFCLADAPQPMCEWPIETNDTRLLNAVSWKGKIWTTHEVGSGAPEDDDCGLVVPRTKVEVAWYEIDPAAAGSFPGGAPNQQGRVVHSSLYYYFPSIAVNKNECVAIGFSGSDDNTFASAFYTVHDPAVDAPGTTQPVSLLKAGVDAYLRTHLDKDDRNRWGDYSATVVDPRDFSTFWTVQEYAEDQNDGLPPAQDCALDAGTWGTWWGSFQCENTIDGWFVRFYEPLQKDETSKKPLAEYYCDVKVVDIDPTKLADCQDHNVFEYEVNLEDCCLVHSNIDTRNGYRPALKDAFHEEEGLQYNIDIQAVIGVKYWQDKETGECFVKKTGKGASDHFWGWHTTVNENGFKSALEVTKGDGAAVSWQNFDPKCSDPNMAFELLTDIPDHICKPSSPPWTEKPKYPTNRFLPIKAGDPKQIQAIRVRFVSLPPPFNVWNGMDFWAGEPQEVCENSGQGLNVPAAMCSPNAGPTRTFWAAPLVCEKAAAHYMDWHGQCVAGICVGGLEPGKTCLEDDDCQVKVALYNEGIIPSDPNKGSAIYDVQVIDVQCPNDDEGSYSIALTMIQSRWGDVCGPGPGGACTGQADGVVDVTNDVLGVLDKFTNTNNLQKIRADIEPGDEFWTTGKGSNGPDFMVNVANDVLFVLNAFMGSQYPFLPKNPCAPGLAEGDE